MPADFQWNQGAADRQADRVNVASGRAWKEQLDAGNRRAPRLTGRLIGSSQVVQQRSGQFTIEYHVPYAWRQHQRHGWMRPELIDVSQVERSIASSTGEE
ncbi:MAG: hypothetical protein LBJ87_05545 [bacterium]|nr:hypothetical protein [bacterium]